MKDLINDVTVILKTAQTAGTLNIKKIFKGLQDAPELAAHTEYPYVMVDDGGERTEVGDSTTAQNRFYDVVLEVGVYNMNIEDSLEQVLEISNELKAVLEAEENRLKDGFTWGIAITPFGWEKDRYFFRGRQIVMTYTELEDTIDKY